MGLLVTLHSKERPPAPPGKDADPKEYPWYFEWSRTPPGGDRRPPISGGTLREGPLVPASSASPARGLRHRNDRKSPVGGLLSFHAPRMPETPSRSRLPRCPARRGARPGRTRDGGRHAVLGPLRADPARQHQRRRQPAADLPRRRRRLHRRAQPRRDHDDAEQQLQHGVRRRRRRRDHGQLLDLHALAARRRDGHVGRALLGRRHGARHGRLGRRSTPPTAASCASRSARAPTRPSPRTPPTS